MIFCTPQYLACVLRRSASTPIRVLQNLKSTEEKRGLDFGKINEQFVSELEALVGRENVNSRIGRSDRRREHNCLRQAGD